MKNQMNSSLSRAALGTGLLVAGILAAMSNSFADTAYTTTTMAVSHRAVPIKLDIYYPVEKGAVMGIHGKNLVFKGIEISKGTTPVAGKHPVVIFSHGSGGNGINTGWFAKALADQGMIVIAPNHPGSTSRDSDPEQSLKTWERPQDISAIIDQLPALLPAGLHVDEARFAAAGFSLGGYGVLALAGAQINKDAFVDYCEAKTEKELNECDWFTRTGFDLNNINKAGFERNNLEPRIKAVISIDPGFAAAFNGDSLEAISTPVKIINLGSYGSITAGVDGKNIAEQIPGAEYAQIDKAWHFDFLGECTGYGSIFLTVTFDDPICDEIDGGERSIIHAEIAFETVEFLNEQFALTH